MAPLNERREANVPTRTPHADITLQAPLSRSSSSCRGALNMIFYVRKLFCKLTANAGRVQLSVWVGTIALSWKLKNKNKGGKCLLCGRMIFRKEYIRTEETVEILTNIFLRNPLMVVSAFFPIYFYNLSIYLSIYCIYLSVCLSMDLSVCIRCFSVRTFCW